MGNEASSTASNVMQNIQSNVGDQMEKVNRIVVEKTKGGQQQQQQPTAAATAGGEGEDHPGEVIEGPILTPEHVESKLELYAYLRTSYY